MKIKLPGKKHVRTGRTSSVTKSHKGGRKEVLKEEAEVEVLEAPSAASTHVGVNMGLTIPGPENAFMSARVDAWATVPCGNSDKEIRKGYERASELVQEQLEKDADLITQFFKG